MLQVLALGSSSQRRSSVRPETYSLHYSSALPGRNRIILYCTVARTSTTKSEHCHDQKRSSGPTRIRMRLLVGSLHRLRVGAGTSSASDGGQRYPPSFHRLPPSQPCDDPVVIFPPVNCSTVVAEHSNLHIPPLPPTGSTCTPRHYNACSHMSEKR